MLLLAEGEWSKTCGKLGVCKAIDRFSLAIGLVINMLVDHSDPATKKLESFCQTSLGPVVASLEQQGIQVENVEYLKGETVRGRLGGRRGLRTHARTRIVRRRLCCCCTFAVPLLI